MITNTKEVIQAKCWNLEAKVISIKGNRHTADFGDGESAITFCNNCGDSMVIEQNGVDRCFGCGVVT